MLDGVKTGVISVQFTSVKIEKPEAVSLILGQSHFIKTVEDVYEALVGSSPSLRFGLAFCESSGERLVRVTGTDDAMQELAATNALSVGAGHVFVLMLAEGFYPINVLNALKMVPEVCRIYCATANPVEVVIAETEQGRGVMGVVDGLSPLGVEAEDGVAWRKGLLRTIGYKL